MSQHRRRGRLLLLAAVALVAVACGSPPVPAARRPRESGTSPHRSAPPSAAPRRRHRPPDRRDRRRPPLDEGGGFVIRRFLATQVPQFTLYGDGTIVFRTRRSSFRPPRARVVIANPLRTAKLTEGRSRSCSSSRSARAASRPPGRLRQRHGRRRLDRDLHDQRRRPQEDRLGLRPRHRGRRAGPTPRPAPRSDARRAAHATSTRAARSRPTSTCPTAYRAVLLERQASQAPDVKRLAVAGPQAVATSSPTPIRTGSSSRTAR